MAPFEAGGSAPCPIAAALAEGAATLREPGLVRLADDLAAPVRVGVNGRFGAGRSTVRQALSAARQALSAAGVCVCEPDESSEIVVYVFVEALTREDRAALSATGQPTVAVFNKADLSGFGGNGPMAAAAARCRAIQRTVAVPVVPLAALLGRTALDAPAGEDLFDAVAALAGGSVVPVPGDGLLAELDLFGVALAVQAVQGGASRAEVAVELRRVSGIDRVLAELVRAAAEVRYRRARAALTALNGRCAVLNGRCADPGRRAMATFLSSDAVALARMESAVAVVQAAGLRVDMGGTRAGYLRAAVVWQRYARGPVSELHRACGTDIARGALRLLARASGEAGPSGGRR